MNDLPSRIRVGYRTYEIEVMSSIAATARDVFGECCNTTGIIRIRGDIDPVKSANTMIHEVLHACFYVGDLEDDDKQERTVTILANQVTQVWRDNPDLVAWINSRLGSLP